MASYSSLIKTYDAREASGTFRVLVYGNAGSGKTRFASTFPKPLFIDTDKGMRSIPTGDIKMIRLPKVGTYTMLLNILTDIRNKAGDFVPGGPLADRETIVIDSISSLADEYLMQEIMIGNKRDPIMENAQRDDYGRLKIALIQVGNVIKDISDTKNVVVTALVDEEKDELTGALEGKPMMTGKYRDIIGAVFDEEYFMERSEVAGAVKYNLYATKYKWYEAKTRLLDQVRFEDANYDKIRASFRSLKMPPKVS